MTKEKFLDVKLNNISQVYLGKRDWCRCGCGGEYIATTYMLNPRNDINNSIVQKRLNRAKQLLKNGAEIVEGDTYFEVTNGINRCLTFYFDELKS